MSIGSLAIGEAAIGEFAAANDVLVIVPAATVAVSAAAPIINAFPRLPVASVTVTAPAPIIRSGAQPIISGSFAIGEAAIGEFIAPDAVVNVPVAAISVSAAGPIVNAFPRLSGAMVAVTAPTPSIRAGVRVGVPAAAVTIASPLPKISISATIKAPLAPIAVTAPAPDLGALIWVPAAHVTVQGFAPSPRAGKQIAAPDGRVAVSAPVPSIRAGARISVPSAVVTAAGPVPRIATGVAVKAWNVITVTDRGGSIADMAIAEYSIAGGPAETRQVAVTARVASIAWSPAIRAGASVRPPSPAVSLLAPVPEIDARRRKVKFFAIAS